MWLITRYGFFSSSMKSKGHIMLRARMRQHLVNLQRAFPRVKNLSSAKILHTPKGDYAYRVEITLNAFVALSAALAQEQTWDNFKTEAQRFNGPGPYVDALHRVWSVMYQLQIPHKFSKEELDDYLYGFGGPGTYSERVLHSPPSKANLDDELPRRRKRWQTGAELFRE